MPINRKSLQELELGDIALIGYPWDTNSSFLRGPAAAPEKIIDAIEIPSANFYTERLHNLEEQSNLVWLGNNHLDDFFDIENTTKEILAMRALPFGLGGDHSVTFPILKGVHAHHGPVTIIQFDAHNDLYDDFEGNPYSHASPFARIMERGLASHLIQVGTRTTTKHQMEQAERFGVEIYPMGNLAELSLSSVKSPIYITFDLDVLDPAFAPGVSHHEPGGMSTREALEILHQIKGRVVGMDIVEYNPDRDINGVTAMAAAKIAKEMIDLLL